MTETIPNYIQKALPFLLEELAENAPFSRTSQELHEKLRNNSEDQKVLEEAMYRISTIRNKELITEEEQDRLKKTVVAFFGLSVGSSAAITWMMQSRAHTIKIADPDTVSPSNLNRLRFGWDKVGISKVDAVEEELVSINPHVQIIGLKTKDKKQMEYFIREYQTPHVIVDAMDDIEGKVLIRKIAKELGIPVLMATDIGDNVLLDIERYDITPEEKPFLGRIPDIEKIDFANLSTSEIRQIAIGVVGLDYNSEKMLISLASIGKNIKTWPQLAATATIAGGFVTTAIKKIVLQENVQSGRYVISLDDILVTDFNSNERVNERKRIVHELKSR